MPPDRETFAVHKCFLIQHASPLSSAGFLDERQCSCVRSKKTLCAIPSQRFHHRRIVLPDETASGTFFLFALEEEPCTGLHHALAGLAIDPAECRRVRIRYDRAIDRVVENVLSLEPQFEVPRS